MREPYQEPRFGNRRWIAWKLVQLAHRIYDAEYIEKIRITNADGETQWEALIVGDLYGCGVSYVYGGDELHGDYTIHWGAAEYE